MRIRITLIFFVMSCNCFGQSDSVFYDWDYVMNYVKKNKSVINGTSAIVKTIVSNYEGENQQLELIKFYNEAFDYKIVHKETLTRIIDSLKTNGLSEEIRLLANQSKDKIEFRLKGKKIKDFKLVNKNSDTLSISSLSDKIIIVELWTTWCGPCIKEMTKIPKIRTDNVSIEFYSISLDKDFQKMKKFIEKNGYDWPIVFGGDQNYNKELWNYFNIVAIPKYYVVDRDGIIINSLDNLDLEYLKSLQ